MEKRPFGPSGIPFPVIGQGTWKMEQDDRSRVIAALRRGIDAGLTHIDTAELYGSGAVEEIVGEAIEGRRDEVLLVSKVLPGNASHAGTIRACERTLRRLRTDHLDLYLLHWPGDHALEETFAAFEELERAGKIRAFGVSNFDVADLERAHAVAGAHRIACNQVLYHLDERAIEHAVVPWCARHGIAVVGYSPFGSRRSLGRGAGVLREIAEARGVPARQVALAFLIRLPATFTIPKSSRVEHVDENAAAAGLRLTDPEIARLDAAFPLGRRPRELPTI